mmetsp:Transcript_12546/g.35931  ORF Transcript_12546/g.35931 Transcript_12546/m.35931 type:complete len:272 (-) Transcript_12546:1358-2173(-)
MQTPAISMAAASATSTMSATPARRLRPRAGASPPSGPRFLCVFGCRGCSRFAVTTLSGRRIPRRRRGRRCRRRRHRRGRTLAPRAFFAPARRGDGAAGPAAPPWSRAGRGAAPRRVLALGSPRSPIAAAPRQETAAPARIWPAPRASQQLGRPRAARPATAGPHAPRRSWPRCEGGRSDVGARHDRPWYPTCRGGRSPGWQTGSFSAPAVASTPRGCRARRISARIPRCGRSRLQLCGPCGPPSGCSAALSRPCCRPATRTPTSGATTAPP